MSMPIPTSNADALAPEVRRGAFEDLCATFDPLLRPDAGPAPPSVREELETFARILDVEFDAELAEGEIWRQVRPRLARQLTADETTAELGSVADAGRIFVPANVGGGGFLDAAPTLALLVVEDDPDLSSSMVQVLTDAGHRVIAAVGSAEAAASIASHQAFDFAIVDVGLEGMMDGVDLAQKLHANWGARVLFVSGAPNESLASHKAAVGFLGKPFNGQELLAAVTLADGLLRRERE